MVLSIIAIVIALISILLCVHVSIVYRKFNDSIKEWAQDIDTEMNNSLNRVARNILRELDVRISAQSKEDKEENND